MPCVICGQRCKAGVIERVRCSHLDLRVQFGPQLDVTKTRRERNDAETTADIVM